MAPRAWSACPLPGTPGAPYFDGHNITDFLDRYIYMCKTYDISNEAKVARLPEYCTRLHAQFIETRPEWKRGHSEWFALTSVLKNRYRSKDYTQRVNTREYLHSYKSIKGGTDDVEEYCRTFTAISEVLISAEVLDKRTQWEWFLAGLPNQEVVRACMDDEMRFHAHGRVEVDFESLVVRAIKAERAIRVRKYVSGRNDPAQMVRDVQALKPKPEQGATHVEGTYPVDSNATPPKGAKVDKELSPTRVETENLVTKEDLSKAIEELGSSIKALLTASQGDVYQLSNSIKALESDVSTLVEQRQVDTSPPTSTPSHSTESRIDTLAKPSAQEKQREQLPQPEPLPEPESQSQPPSQQPPPPQEPPTKEQIHTKFPPGKCLYCYSGGHRRRDCPEFNAAIRRGEVHINAKNHLSLGPWTPNCPSIPLVVGRCQKDLVEEALRRKEEAEGLRRNVRYMGGRDGDGVAEDGEESSSVEWRGGSSVSASVPASTSETKDTSKHEVRYEDEAAHEPEPEPELLQPDPSLDIEPEPEPEPAVHHPEIDPKPYTYTHNRTLRPPQPSPAPPQTQTRSQHDQDDSDSLPSLAPCSDAEIERDTDTESHSPQPPSSTSHHHHHNLDDSYQHSLLAPGDDEEGDALDPPTEAIEHMRTMETVNVEEFSVRSRGRGRGRSRGKPQQQQQQQPVAAEAQSQSQSQSHSNSITHSIPSSSTHTNNWHGQGPSPSSSRAASEVSGSRRSRKKKQSRGATAAGAGKAGKKGKKGKKVKNGGMLGVEGTVVRDGEVGIEVGFGD
ncbi:hypothetical protein FQN54_003772 [Arachnomyces sp. PD_36]|nr:hypothetical protein FQN54_003772 [Arachnomyces sp. PD_36]